MKTGQSVFPNFSPGGKFKGGIRKTVIRSDKRLTYKQAYTLLFNEDIKAARELSYHPLTKLDPLGEPLLIFRKKRSNASVHVEEALENRFQTSLRSDATGSLDLDMRKRKSS